jgi:hypothetical protein
VAGPDTSYAAVALQLAARSVEALPDRAAVSAQMLRHIEEVGTKLRAASIFVTQYTGSPVRLAVLPEYLFTSYPGRISIPEFAAKAAIDIDGPEYEAWARSPPRRSCSLPATRTSATGTFRASTSRPALSSRLRGRWCCATAA